MSQFQKKLVKVQESMLATALKFTHNREEAKDLLQETILRALENEKKYTDQNNLEGWLYRILQTTFINGYNKNLRMTTIINKSTDISNVEHNYSSDSPDSICNIEEITAAINRLSEDLKIPFSLLREGYKYTDIADILQRPLGTIKNQIFQARQILQKELKDFEWNED